MCSYSVIRLIAGFQIRTGGVYTETDCLFLLPLVQFQAAVLCASDNALCKKWNDGVELK